MSVPDKTHFSAHKGGHKGINMIWSNTIDRLSENVHQIHLGGTSVTVLQTIEGLILFDSGFKWNGNALEKSIESLGFSINDISHLLMTHYHPDHSGGLHSLVNKGVSKIYIHTKDSDVITGKTNMPGLIRNPLLGLFGNPFLSLLKGKPIGHSFTLDGGEKIGSSIPIEVIHTPGHTDGSVCYYLPTEGILIAGDALSVRKKELFAPSKTFSNDWNQAVKSLNRLIEFDYNIVSLSHYRPILKDGRSKVQRLIEELNK